MKPSYEFILSLIALCFFHPHTQFFLFSASAAVCQRRIRTTRKMQDDQFKSEIKNLEAMQATAYDQIRVHRLVAVRCLFRWKLIEFSISIVLRASRLLCATLSLETERRFFHCNNFFRSTRSFFAGSSPSRHCGHRCTVVERSRRLSASSMCCRDVMWSESTASSRANIELNQRVGSSGCLEAMTVKQIKLSQVIKCSWCSSTYNRPPMMMMFMFSPS